jgi:hypothetical protein
VSHVATHTCHEDRRVYTDAEGRYYDANLYQRPCLCSLGADHHVIVQREPFVPPDET